jgi:gas vesicle protein
MTRNIYGFLAGLGAGAAAAMLLAPRTGKQTRSLVGKRAAEGAAYLRDRGTDVRDAAAEAIRESTRSLNKGTEAVKAAVEAGKHAYSDLRS